MGDALGVALGFGEAPDEVVVAGAAHAVSNTATEVRAARIVVCSTNFLMSFTLTVPCCIVVATMSQDSDGGYFRYRPNHSMMASKRCTR